MLMPPRDYRHSRRLDPICAFQPQGAAARSELRRNDTTHPYFVQLFVDARHATLRCGNCGSRLTDCVVSGSYQEPGKR
jgi:hypothetical protein